MAWLPLELASAPADATAAQRRRGREIPHPATSPRTNNEGAAAEYGQRKLIGSALTSHRLSENRERAKTVAPAAEDT